jgi:hypothetical protein
VPLVLLIVVTLLASVVSYMYWDQLEQQLQLLTSEHSAGQIEQGIIKLEEIIKPLSEKQDL